MGCDAGKLRRTGNVGLYLQLVRTSCLEERPPAAGLAWLRVAVAAGFPGSGAVRTQQRFSALRHRKALDRFLCDDNERCLVARR